MIDLNIPCDRCGSNTLLDEKNWVCWYSVNGEFKVDAFCRKCYTVLQPSRQLAIHNGIYYDQYIRDFFGDVENQDPAHGFEVITRFNDAKWTPQALKILVNISQQIHTHYHLNLKKPKMRKKHRAAERVIAALAQYQCLREDLEFANSANHGLSFGPKIDELFDALDKYHAIT